MPRITYMYTLVVESSRFFLFFQIYLSTKITYTYTLGVESSHFFLFLQYMSIPKSHTCTSWKWKAHVSFYFSNTLQYQTSHTCTSWKWKAQVSVFLVHPGSGKLTFLSVSQIYFNVKNHIHTLVVESSHFYFSNILQCKESHTHVYTLEVKISRFFPFIK